MWKKESNGPQSSTAENLGQNSFAEKNPNRQNSKKLLKITISAHSKILIRLEMASEAPLMEVDDTGVTLATKQVIPSKTLSIKIILLMF